MLKLLIREYLAICKYLLEVVEARRKNSDELPELPMIRKGKLLVDKELLIELLDKNKYETSANKLKFWKELAWIDAEENRLTKRICINNRYRPLIVINLQRYECIQKLDFEVKTL